MEIYHNHLKAIIKLVFGISEGFKYGTPSPGHDPQPHFGRTDPPHTYNPIPHGPYPTEPPHTFQPHNPGQYSLATESPKHGK